MYHVTGSDGVVYGPIDASTLRAWIADGRVDAATLVYGGASSEWVSLSRHPGFPAEEPVSPTRRRLKTKHLALIAGAVVTGVLILALVVAGVALAPSGRTGLFPDVVMSGLRGSGGATPHPAPPIGSAAPAVRENPAPGIEIEAAAGALDQPRTFTAAPLGGEQLISADQKLLDQGLIALGGWDIDAGMSETDLFFDPVTMTFDLEELGIPEDLWGQVGIANIDSEGTVALLHSQHKGSKLSIETWHNGAWLPVLVPALLGTMYYGWTVDRAELPKGDFSAIYWKPDGIRYRILYSPSWQPRNEAEVKRAEAEYGQLIEKHKLTKDDLKADARETEAAPTPMSMDPFSDLRDLAQQMAERVERLERLYSDPEYKKLRDTVRSEQWLKENFLPPRVTNAIVGLDRAWDYLDERGFRKPGIAKFETTTDVFLVDTSLGPEGFGEVRNTWTTMPFVVLDGTKIPDADLDTLDPAQKVVFDEYQSTALHELFHVVQSAYVFHARNKYTWFDEAAAVLLEHEAQEYYTSKKSYAQSWRTTKRSYDSFFQTMDFFDSKENRSNQQHGYGQSYFWQFLCDYYFTLSGSKEAFLVQLYEDFSRLRGGTLDSLYRTTGGTPETLTKAFYAFSYSAADDLQTANIGLAPGPAKTVVSVESTTPLHIMRFADGGTPLSVSMLEVRTAGVSSAPSADSDPVYVLSTNGIEDLGAIVRVSARTNGAETWDEIRGGCVLPAERRMHVMRAETYVETPGELSSAGEGLGANGPVVFGMFVREAPTVEIEDETLIITWKPSAAANVKRSDGTRALISQYRVTLTTPGGRETNFLADEPRAEMPVAMLDKIVTAAERTNKNHIFKYLRLIGERDQITLIQMAEALGEGEKPKIKVAYREVAAIPGSPKGPLSKVAEFEYGDEDRATGDVTGTWGGSVPFSEGNLMRLDIIETGGGNIRGTMHWGDEIPFRGTWNPTSKSWSLEGRESNVWLPMFLVFNGHLQKLPGDRLYMFAPPALLSRADKATPDLGWQPEPEDTDLKNVLEQLQYELEQMQSPGQEVAP